MQKAVALVSNGTTPTTRARPGLSTTQRIECLIGAVVLTAVFTLSCAFASGNAIQNGIKSGAQQLYSVMTAVILPIGAICFAWNAFKALFGGERGMEQAKKNMLTIVIVLALVYLAPVIITQIGGWFSPSSSWSF